MLNERSYYDNADILYIMFYRVTMIKPISRLRYVCWRSYFECEQDAIQFTNIV